MSALPFDFRTQLGVAQRRHRATPLFLVVALLATLVLAVTGSPARAAGTLLSQGKPVTASSVENAGTPASAAVDGNAGTRWSSSASDPQWIQVDLGATATISQVVLSWEAAYGKAYQLQTSADGTTWTTVYATTTATGGTETLNVTGTGRYVRMNGTQRATGYGYSLWEFQVFTGTSGDNGPVLLSYGKPATASSFQDDGNCSGCTPAKAFDANAATRWATSATTGWSDPAWIAVDLGASATVSKVVLQWDPAFASAYQIQTSPDGANWTTIYSTTTSTGFKQTLDVSGTGRYVRMYGTARGTAYGYSLWGFDVYGTGGNPTAPPALPPAPGNPQKLLWSDEFNSSAGTGADPAKWTVDSGAGVNNELEYYTTGNRNTYQDGTGNLVLEARKEVTAGSSCPRAAAGSSCSPPAPASSRTRCSASTSASRPPSPPSCCTPTRT